MRRVVSTAGFFPAVLPGCVLGMRVRLAFVEAQGIGALPFEAFCAKIVKKSAKAL